MTHRAKEVVMQSGQFSENAILSLARNDYRSDEIVLILKPFYGAFYDTPLATILKNLHQNTVIICGTLTKLLLRSHCLASL
jgi:nicotinamidase-related amidase